MQCSCLPRTKERQTWRMNLMSVWKKTNLLSLGVDVIKATNTNVHVISVLIEQFYVIDWSGGTHYTCKKSNLKTIQAYVNLVIESINWQLVFFKISAYSAFHMTSDIRRKYPAIRKKITLKKNGNLLLLINKCCLRNLLAFITLIFAHFFNRIVHCTVHT